MQKFASLKWLWSIYREVVILVIGIFVVSLILLFSYIFLAPADFVNGTTITVEKGSSLNNIAKTLEKDHVVRSAFWFQFFTLMLANEKNIEAGEYRFESPLPSFAVARVFAYGQRNSRVVKGTIPEGLTNKEIAVLLTRKLALFNAEDFLSKAKEGYSFPDTYFFTPEATADDVLEILTGTFHKKTAELQTKTLPDGVTFDDIIKMASILEKEARTSKDMAMVSDILWRRIQIGIPLQVDASFAYILGKGTSELTLEDLSTDSPYNSYIHRGLPPTPISNPGLNAINAAISPISNQYLYFLTGKDGEMYYSKTFEEHVAKKQKYL